DAQLLGGELRHAPRVAVALLTGYGVRVAGVCDDRLCRAGLHSRPVVLDRGADNCVAAEDPGHCARLLRQQQPDVVTRLLAIRPDARVPPPPAPPLRRRDAPTLAPFELAAQATPLRHHVEPRVYRGASCGARAWSTSVERGPSPAARSGRVQRGVKRG